MVSGNRSASSRRTLVAMGLAALLCASSAVNAHGQGAAAAKPDPLKFTTDDVIILYTIKADKSADFEAVWATLKDKLAKSEKADLKELGASISILKVNSVPDPAAPTAPAVYLFHLNPPSKTLSYDPVQIIYSSGLFPVRADADAIYTKLGAAFVSIVIWPLVKVGG